MRIREIHPLLGELVDVRRFDHRVPRATEEVETLVVGEEEDDVRVLKKTTPEQKIEIPDSEVAFVGAITMRMRVDYQSCAEQIARIRQGEMVQTLDVYTFNDQDWVQISYQGLLGWVLRDELVVDRLNSLLNQIQTVK